MSNYEEEKLQRIAKNEAKFEALGISRKVSSLRVLTQNTKNKKGRRIDEENDEEYKPKELEELQSSSEEDEKYNKKNITRPLRLNSKRVDAYELEKVELDKLKEFKTCPDQSVVKKRGGHTINAKLPSKREELMVLGKTFDIQFPPPYFKLCGKHAKYFKAEATVCIRHKAPLKVKTWKEIPEDDLTIMWKHMEVSITLLM
ncbi:hypothetical protein DEO72_LG10g2666 [Vigna unguiculata]|uniref:Uncharacterized protein n=1 Tax=Vigna unguiculata TaxID=3917 RepID=A0A4D6NC74_VIGUN|nr:hypothetical protein DEO72_LG10g2666 [Vigna unguiculata]